MHVYSKHQVAQVADCTLAFATLVQVPSHQLVSIAQVPTTHVGKVRESAHSSVPR